MIIFSTNIHESELETYRRRGISIAHCPFYDLKYVDNIHHIYHNCSLVETSRVIETDASAHGEHQP